MTITSDASSSRATGSLDPEDWDAMRALGHRMIDDMFAYLQTVRERPVWQPVPDHVKAALSRGLPHAPQEPAEIYSEFLSNVLPYALGNIHPRFWGWVIGTGTPFGMLAEMLAAGMNPNVGGASQGAAHVERQVLGWCKEIVGYPADASGLLVSGGSMANLVGLAVGRNARAGFDVGADGLLASSARLVLYSSTETHNSVAKSVRLLGLGNASLRQIEVNDRFEVDVAALEAAVADDRRAGHRPFAIIGNAGTVNTGAIDDLTRLAEISEREGLWFHVDGAFGALAALVPSLAPRLAGMARADSIAFDLHKWMYMNYDVGCVLIRNRDEHRRAFTVPSGYLSRTNGGMATGEVWFSELGPELSRCFRALKVWMSIKEHGIDRYGEAIAQNIEQAEYLARLIDESPELERLAPVPLNIVCFRYRGAKAGLKPGATEPHAGLKPGANTLDDKALDRLNEQILVEIQESGVAAPSFTRIHGKFAIRVANCNHRSRREDFDLLVREVSRLGNKLSG